MHTHSQEPRNQGPFRELLTLLAATAALVLLAACGGGGGGGGAPGPQPLICQPGFEIRSGTCQPITPQPCPSGQTRIGGICVPTPSPNTPCTSQLILAGTSCQAPRLGSLPDEATSLNEWRQDTGFTGQNALEYIGAHYAFGDSNGVGYTGEGVTVGVMSDGIEPLASFQSMDANAPRLERITTVEYSSRFTAQGDFSSLNTNRTLRAPDSPPLRCGKSSTQPCDGTREAGIIAGNILNDAGLVENRSLLGAAPAAALVDIPFRDFLVNFCDRRDPSTGYLLSNCPSLPYTQRQRDNVDQPITTLRQQLVGSAMDAALAHANKPDYIFMHETWAGRGAYLPDFSSTNLPTDGSLNWRTFLQDFVTAIGHPVWQGGAPASGEDTRTVFVFDAGNDYEGAQQNCVLGQSSDCRPEGENRADRPRYYGLLPQIVELVGGTGVPRGSDLKATFLVVVGLGEDEDSTTNQREIWARSNRCGIAKEWCLAAPAVNLRGYVTTGPHTRTIDGTEYAAALVTGALALVDSAFNADGDAVSPVAVRKRLLDTADSSGIYSDEDIYGHGVVDVRAALQPQGSTTSPAPPSLPGAVGHVQGPGHATRGMALALPASVRAALDGTTMMVLDAQGFPFQMGLGHIAREPAAVVPLFTTLAAQRPPMYAGGLGISAGSGEGGWSSALTPQHMLHGHGGAPFAPGGQDAGWRQAGSLAAGSHLAVSPLMASSLDSGGTRHLAVRARFGNQTLGAMACTQNRGGQALDGGAETRAGDCMALGWDWAAGPGLGFSVRTHRLDSRAGLYRYGLRCFGTSCGGGGASATELGLGGFAKLSQGLRLGWNYWRGWADDQAGGATLHYRGMGHSSGSIALEDPRGRWSLYLQQPLRTQGTLQLVLPHRRDPAGHVYFRSHEVSLDGVARPLRLGLSGRLALARSGGFVAMDLGSERGLDGAVGVHPYLSLEARIPW